MNKQVYKPKLLIAIPHMGTFSDIFFNSFFQMMLRVTQYKNLEVGFQMISNSLIYEAREMFIDFALENKYDYILFLDSDMQFPEDIIEKLIAHGKEITSGLYFKRQPPYTPLVYKREIKDEEVYFYQAKELGKGLYEVDGVGAGCMLIKTEVFTKIEQPFFYPWISSTKQSGLSEDLAFCHRAREVGYKIYVDTNVECGHVTQDVVRRTHWDRCKEKNI